MHRHLRSNSIAGLMLLLGAILIAAGSLAPWAKISGPEIPLAAAGKEKDLGLDIVPILHRSGDVNIKTILLVVTAVIASCAIALIVTRVRWLGVLCRLGALAALTVPVLLTLLLWRDITRDPADVLEDPNARVLDKIKGLFGSALEHLHLIKIEPDLGLWLLTAGILVAVLGVSVPTVRTK
jgi:hypothetical protein